MNSKAHTSKYLTLNQAHSLIAAASHAFCIGRLLSVDITIHFNQAGVTEPHAFVTAFFKWAGDWLRVKTKEPPYYAWALENGLHKGLHLHALMHVPHGRIIEFRRCARRWIKMHGVNARWNAIEVLSVDNFGTRQRLFDEKRDGWIEGWPDENNPERHKNGWADETWLYLGWWGYTGCRQGLKGALGYMLKGLDPKGCDYLGIERIDQGIVMGKRCGFSQSLGNAAKKKLEPTLRRSYSNYPKVVICGPELRRKRWLHYAGFLPDTDYEAVSAPADGSNCAPE